jgi:predicted transposase YbfD/YdcC
MPSILQHFSELDEPRVEGRTLYPMEEILLLTLCAVLSGAETWVEIVVFGKHKLEWLRTFLAFEKGIPSHDTLGDFFAALNAQKFESCFMKWMQSICPSVVGKVIAVDGKTVRRSHNKSAGQRAIHLVSAFASEGEILLGQLKTEEKSNEITAIPELLEAIDIKGATITIDAMGCQTDIAEKIIHGGGDYILAVKNNQPTLYEAIESFFDISMESRFKNVPYTFHEQVEKDHGRIETRRCWSVSGLDWLESETKDRWISFTSVSMIESVREIKGEISTERRYYIGSVPAEAQRVA